MATEYHEHGYEHGIKHTTDETGNFPPETMNEAMNDYAKDPGPFQQRSDPATEHENAVVESMNETMDGDLAATTVSTPTPKHQPDLKKNLQHKCTPSQKRNEGGLQAFKNTEGPL